MCAFYLVGNRNWYVLSRVRTKRVPLYLKNDLYIYLKMIGQLFDIDIRQNLY